MKIKILMACAIGVAVLSAVGLGSGYTGTFDQALDRATIVASGRVTFLEANPDGKNWGKYRLEVSEYYKGEREEKELIFYDLYYHSTASLHLGGQDNYLVFLQDPASRNRGGWGAQQKDTNVISGFYAMALNEKTREAVRPAVTALHDYRQLRTLDEQKQFLVRCLEQHNPFLDYYIRREIRAKKIVEAIPAYEKRLRASSERGKLNAVRELITFNHPRLNNVVIEWLNDPAWTDQKGLTQLAVDMKIREVIPRLRKQAFSRDEWAASKARAALLGFEEPDAKTLLFSTIHTALDQSARFTAIFALQNNDRVSFTEEELDLLKAVLLFEKDHNIRERTGSILEKSKSAAVEEKEE